MKTSNPQTLFQYYPSPISTLSASNLDEDIWISLTNGSGSISYNASNYMNLQISTTGDYAIRYTKQPIDYQPGKSRLIYMTGLLLSNALSVGNTLTSRFGLFNVGSDNTTVTSGVYFQTDGTNLQWCETTQTTTTIVNQSSWNIDTFNGSGPSGQTLTSSNLQTNFLIVISSEWLGVGIVKVGFFINGSLFYAHQFTHYSYSVQYTTTPRQRLCYQIIGTTITTTNSLRQYCCTNISEGGFIPLGKRISIATTISGVTLPTIGTKYILLALKLQSTYTNGTIKPLRITASYNAAANKMGFIQLQLHSSFGSVGVISGTLSYSSLKDSISQYAIGNNTQTITTDGYILSSSFVPGQSEINFSSNDFETLLTRSICTQYDTLYLIGTGNTQNDVLYGCFDFIEDI